MTPITRIFVDNLVIPKTYAYLRLKAGADIRAAMSHIRSTLSEFDSDYPFNVRFFDEVLLVGVPACVCGYRNHYRCNGNFPELACSE